MIRAGFSYDDARTPGLIGLGEIRWPATRIKRIAKFICQTYLPDLLAKLTCQNFLLRVCDMNQNQSQLVSRWKREADAAVIAVRQAAIVCRAIQAQMVPEQAVAKQDKSPVTAADFASQAVVCGVLKDAFPNDPIVGEEAAAILRQDSQAALRELIVHHVGVAMSKTVPSADVLDWIDRGRDAGKSDRYWTLDPIDGTKGFLRRGQYAIALALIENGQIVLGALGCPQLPDGQGGVGTLLISTLDKGVQRLSLTVGDNTPGVSMQTAKPATAAQARMCESVESGHSDQDASALIARDLGLVSPPVRMDSQAKYAALACGDADIYLRLPRNREYREMIWDHAAGVIAVQQAGGTVTDIEGKPLDFSLGRRLEANLGVVATTGNIHAQVLKAVQTHCNV